MEWVTTNFAALSAVLVLGAATASVVSVLSYLSVFDWTLIWLLEYSDLTKLFPILGSLLGSLIISISGILNLVY
jgi:hypothetical protein